MVDLLQDKCGRFYTYGIDFYYDEWPFDLKKIKEAGNFFAILKITEGDWETPLVNEMVQAIKDAGLWFGVYHYATPWTDGKRTFYDVDQEFDRFMRTYHRFDGYDFPPILDLENHTAEVSNQQRTDWTRDFMERLEEETGQIPWLYTSRRYMDKYMVQDHGLERYPLWQVDYGHPDGIPEGWEEVAMLQYTSAYRVPEAKDGKLDRNILYLKYFDALKVAATIE